MRLQTYEGKVRAPEFPTGLDWINTDAPITMASLVGKVVMLDFWTYGCINCIHVIPDLKKLEAEFPNELVVIGVHSAKFSNEKNTENIRNITQRYGVTHPVVNDKDFAIWNAYAVNAWPTLMLIDPAGKVFGYHAGEGVYDAAHDVVKGMIDEFKAKNLINETPITFQAKPAEQAATDLLFPGKVLADAANNRLFISDSNHNRIIITTLDTFEIQAVIGSGEAALTDGDYATAAFNGPQGLALNTDGKTLYVADTKNHAIRAVDLTAQQVKRIAGTGEQNLNEPKEGRATEIQLASPWDLVYVKDVLYIAMAGVHQLWRLNLVAGTIQPHAGSRAEGILDGALLDAQLAQPSGIATDGNLLYFADSESSSIRIADISPTGTVRTVVGQDLFIFGDEDGRGSAVRLQHPLGVTVGEDGKLYIADTYNSKIKVIVPKDFTSTTLAGSEEGFKDGKGAEAQFYEPGGLSYAAGKLYVADTNNNAIRVVDVATGEVSTVKFANPEVLAADTASTDDGSDDGAIDFTKPSADFYGDEIKLDPVEVAPGQGTLILNFTFPDGYKVNNLAPFTLVIYNTSEVAHVEDKDNDMRAVEPPLPLQIPITFKQGESTLIYDVTVVYCEAINPQVCFFGTMRFDVPLKVVDGAASPDVKIDYAVQIPATPGSSIGN
ncbi:MAG: redoxin domain-containing protein [Anaerolineae bacterium]|nr:redoxin domain-containing protein [Anaerolineae bacterium]